MKNKENLDAIIGVWESVNLNPAAIVIRDFEGVLRLMLLHVNVTTLQASPAVYEVEQDENGLFIGAATNYQRVGFDPLSDTLTLSDYGDYMRN